MLEKTLMLEHDWWSRVICPPIPVEEWSETQPLHLQQQVASISFNSLRQKCQLTKFPSAGWIAKKCLLGGNNMPVRKLVISPN